ncbi:hypothetical protein BTUL_0061g00040 [Botrytis tulipae]|uniref:Uncharacterized protein n=1 Tax=Botrytis tulipae TaxID=87230 RepID=A0A4Z1EYK1_9HELO|nr:hypothetical protein BTUL_0061g00040 [Botrytis tulipae]
MGPVGRLKTQDSRLKTQDSRLNSPELRVQMQSQDKRESVFPRNLKFERERQGYGEDPMCG